MSAMNLEILIGVMNKLSIIKNNYGYIFQDMNASWTISFFYYTYSHVVSFLLCALLYFPLDHGDKNNVSFYI